MLVQVEYLVNGNSRVSLISNLKSSILCLKNDSEQLYSSLSVVNEYDK